MYVKINQNFIYLFTASSGVRAPVIISPHQNITVLAGSTTILECLVQGWPRPSTGVSQPSQANPGVYWTRQSEWINSYSVVKVKNFRGNFIDVVTEPTIYLRSLIMQIFSLKRDQIACFPSVLYNRGFSVLLRNILPPLLNATIHCYLCYDLTGHCILRSLIMQPN